MKLNAAKFVGVIALAALLPLISTCVIILVEQPSTVTSGESITINIEYHTIYADENPHYGILGLLIPNDWIVVSVNYDGDFGSGECMFLHPDSSDWEPGIQDFWTDSLELHFPSGDSMQWVVYQSDEPYAVDVDTSYVDGTFEMIVGQSSGTFDLGYFVASAASEIHDPGGGIVWYGISLDNPVEVSGGTEIGSTHQLPVRYSLDQNYPNPFNPSTNINFSIPAAEFTTLEVYNILGAKVKTLVHGVIEQGQHQVEFEASDLESGVYYYKLQSGAYTSIKKLAFVK